MSVKLLLATKLHKLIQAENDTMSHLPPGTYILPRYMHILTVLKQMHILKKKCKNLNGARPHCS